MFRRSAVLAAGGFPEDLSPAADYSLYLRLVRKGQLVVDSHEAVAYRQHAEAMSRDPARMLRATLEVLRREGPYVPSTHRALFGRGLGVWRTYYGDQIVDALREGVWAGRWGRWHWAAAATLAIHAPDVIVAHLRRKVTQLFRRRPEPLDSIPPS